MKLATRVLVVEDDPRIAANLRAYLERDGFEVACASDGAAAVRAGEGWRPHAVLLDLGLPDADGLELCRELRAFGDCALLMVTARTTLDDRLRGLERGADDYITKPFSTREVVARLQAVLRRTRPADGVLVRGALRIDPAARTVHAGGQPVALTRTEFELLAALAAAPSVVHRRAALIERALGFDYAGGERTIDTHVTNLRRKLGAHGRAIVTVFGVGYRFEPAP